MKNFYKLNPLQVGQGTLIPDDFKEYEIGKEPDELLQAIELEKQEQEVKLKVQEAKTYLASTDWIVTKINEAQIKGEVITELLTKYNTELVKREECRIIINTIEGS